ncbi:hypothetical protein J1614_006228 [Plenodomus biglobosus]|nr:hypothetical protein J1614_006228 [Plenodomus biglobosus]
MDSDVGSREEHRPEWLPESTCPLCFDLGEVSWTLDHIKTFGDIPFGYIDFAQLDVAAGGNCAGCQIIRQILQPYNLQLRNNGLFVILELRRPPDDKITYLPEVCIMCGGSYAGEGGRRSSKLRIVELQVGRKILGTERSAFPWECIQPMPKISGHTGSQEALHSARLWLGSCLDEHKGCKPNTRVRLPTRVLQIQGPKKICLIDSATSTGYYACLSYCWGKKPLIGTTSDNIDAHSNDIPWKDLPKTYQDAITFAHNLGLEYMWIDSLCILQDSDEDWRNEGGKMTQIYTNAHITLSAASSADAYEGCFFASSTSHSSRTLEFVGKDGKPYNFHCREKISSRDMPLAKRGWTYQERLLSNRIIHFTKEELVWECNERCVCECSAVGHYNGGGPGLGLIKQLCGLRDNSQIEDIWQSIIEDYSERSLTYPSDRLPAIQGLAKMVPATMGAYLAGHWSATLIQSLCWCSIERPLQSCIWRAPSWSWASATGSVRWETLSWSREDKCYPVSILSAMTTPKGNDPTGEVIDGKLVLRGICVEGRVFLNATSCQGDGQTDIVYFRADRPCRSQYHEVVDSQLYETRLWDCRLRHDGGRALAMKIMVSKTYPDYQIWLYLGALESNLDTYERLCVEDTMSLGIDERIQRRKIYTSLEREMVVTVV